MVKRKGSISNTSNPSKNHQSDHFSKILSRLESLPNSKVILSAFRELPSKAVVPDYYDIIKQPISIAEIEKAAVKAADELEVIYKSFKLMRENARTYNDSRSEIAINAGIILKVVGDYILEIALGKSSKSFIDAFNRRQLQILDELMRLKASRRNIAELFLEEPSKELYPDYYQLISTPTSLNTVKAKVLAGELRTVESFRQAVELIFTNAYTYNNPTSQVYVDAQTLEKHFINQVEKLKLPAEPTKYQETATKLMNGEYPLIPAEAYSETPKIGTLKLKLKTPVSKESSKEPTKEAPKVKLNLKEPEKIKIKLSHKKEEAVQKPAKEIDVVTKPATANEEIFTEDKPAKEPQETDKPSVEESKLEPPEENNAIEEPVETPSSEPKLDTPEDAPETETTEPEAIEPEDVMETPYNPEESLFQHIIINPVIPITSKYHLYKSPPPAGLLNLFQVNFLPSQKKPAQSFALTVPSFHNAITLNATLRETLHSQPYDLVVSHNYKKLEPFASSTDSKFVRSKSSLDSVFKNIQGAGFNEINHWGVAHLQSLIDDANAKGTVIMKPVLDNKSKHDRLKTALSLIERNKYLFNLPSAILHHVKINDHDSLVRDFRRGRDIRYSEENQLVDPNAKEVLDLEKVTDRIWGQVKNIVEDYKKQEWKKLANITADQNYLGVISKLLELGCEDNPIHEWISSQIGLFETEARAAFEKLKSTTDVNRINILAVPQNRSAPLISALREIEKASEQPDILLDNFSVIEMWITIKVVTEDIANLMTRFCQFWQCCQGFLEGTLQANLPKGWHNESVPHLSFSPNEVQEIQKQGRGIADLIANETNQFFSSMSMLPLTENINSTSQLLNVSAKKPSRRKSSIMSNSAPTEIEVPSFLPPNSNALSATKYLPSLIFQLASGFNDFARLRLSSKTEEHLQEVLSVIREKSINAVLYAWAQDSTYLCLAENWTLSPNNRHLTKIPSLIRTYEVQVIQGLSSIMYITYNNQTLEDGQDIIPPVTSKLLSKVLSSFSGSISSGLDGIMKLVLPAENSHHRRSVSGSSILSQSGSSITASETNNLLPDSLSPDKKTLLTISNLNEIRDVIMPYLFKFYERSFNLSSRESANALRKSIDTMDNTLFELYTRRKKTILADLLRTGILKAGIYWTADEPHPRAVSSYIYDCLLTLVVTHSNVLSIAPEQVTRVISVLYDHIVKTLLSCYREIEQFGKYGLLQAIADIGFIRITLEKFQTPDMLNTYRVVNSAAVRVAIRGFTNAQVILDGIFQFNYFLLAEGMDETKQNGKVKCRDGEVDSNPRVAIAGKHGAGAGALG
ncbi:hypothetical protein DV453_003965 [Geotrichum candidum]|nr:hypothetical protein DV453_003965 [Geotrichum candidum]